jgi:hypothetical protein
MREDREHRMACQATVDFSTDGEGDIGGAITRLISRQEPVDPEPIEIGTFLALRWSTNAGLSIPTVEN